MRLRIGVIVSLWLQFRASSGAEDLPDCLPRESCTTTLASGVIKVPHCACPELRGSDTSCPVDGDHFMFHLHKDNYFCQPNPQDRTPECLEGQVAYVRLNTRLIVYCSCSGEGRETFREQFYDAVEDVQEFRCRPAKICNGTQALDPSTSSRCAVVEKRLRIRLRTPESPPPDSALWLRRFRQLCACPDGTRCRGSQRTVEEDGLVKELHFCES